jgi:hypothetical protein
MKSKIYQTNIPKELQVRSRGNVVKGIVTDSKTKLVLQAQVELFDLKTNQKISTTRKKIRINRLRLILRYSLL